jgi:hypothetical protein
VAVSTRAVLSALAAIVRGTNVETELHNVGAHVRNAETLVTADAAVLAASAEVGLAAARLAEATGRSGELVLKVSAVSTLEAD